MCFPNCGTNVVNLYDDVAGDHDINNDENDNRSNKIICLEIYVELFCNIIQLYINFMCLYLNLLFA